MKYKSKIDYSKSSSIQSNIESPKGWKSWMKSPEGLALFAFACGSMFLHGHWQLRALGLLMFIVWLLTHIFRPAEALKHIFPAPPELFFYSAWIVWSGLTGYLVAKDMTMFWQGYRVALQMLVMVWTAYAISMQSHTINVIIMAILVGGIIQIVSVMLGPTNILDLTTSRFEGLTSNPNTLGIRMVWCVLCALTLWHFSRLRKILRGLFLFVLIPSATYVMFATGSRKSALAMAFLLLCWSFFVSSTAKGIRSYAIRGFFSALILIAIVQILPFVIEHTVLGERFSNFFSEGHSSFAGKETFDIAGAAQHNIRYKMYADGIKVFFKHPIFGVGINNYGKYFYHGQFSHSEFIEPLATTGLPGFILYQAFYVCLLVRTGRLLHSVNDRKKVYRLKVTTLGVVTIMLVGLGTPHYTSQPTFLLLTAFSAYTWNIHRKIMVNRNRVRTNFG